MVVTALMRGRNGTVGRVPLMRRSAFSASLRQYAALYAGYIPGRLDISIRGRIQFISAVPYRSLEIY